MYVICVCLKHCFVHVCSFKFVKLVCFLFNQNLDHQPLSCCVSYLICPFGKVIQTSMLHVTSCHVSWMYESVVVDHLLLTITQQWWNLLEQNTNAHSNYSIYSAFSCNIIKVWLINSLCGKSIKVPCPSYFFQRKSIVEFFLSGRCKSQGSPGSLIYV